MCNVGVCEFCEHEGNCAYEAGEKYKPHQQFLGSSAESETAEDHL
jgi:hypothetical protein